MDLDIKNWEYYLYTRGTPGQRTHSKKEQMYFDNRASKYDATPDKFSYTYLHPSTGKDTYAQRHSKTHYPRLLGDKCWWEDFVLVAKGCLWEVPLGFKV